MSLCVTWKVPILVVNQPVTVPVFLIIIQAGRLRKRYGTALPAGTASDAPRTVSSQNWTALCDISILNLATVFGVILATITQVVVSTHPLAITPCNQADVSLKNAQSVGAVQAVHKKSPDSRI